MSSSEATSADGLLGAFFGDTPLPDGKLLAALRAAGGNALIRTVALHLLLDQMAVEREIGVSDEELQAAVDAFRMQNALEKRADMMGWLQREALDEDSFVDNLERDIRREKLKEAVVPDSEIDRRFLSYRFNRQRACLSRIALPDFGQAEEIRDRIVEGEMAFQEAAVRYAADERDRRSSGYLDWQTRSELDGVVAGAVFSAKAGDVVGPIALEGVFSIFKVWEIQSVEFSAEVRALLRDEIFTEWSQEQAERWNITLRTPA